jgi:hypothetical protein
MLSDDEFKAAAKTALEFGLACAAYGANDGILENLRGGAPVSAGRPEPLLLEYNPATPPTRAEIAEYLDQAGWDPQTAKDLAAAELAVDFGLRLTPRHLRIFAELIGNEPEQDRVVLQLQTLDLLTRWLLRKRRVVGPDGKIVVGVRKWGEAERIVAEWMSGVFATQMDSEPDEPNLGAAALRRQVAHAAASPNRGRRRPIDARKELVARLKAYHLGSRARHICELLDQTIDRAIPLRRVHLAPLESWQAEAPDKRSWVEFYDDSRTHNQVRTYINKVPALQTSAKPSK